MLRISGLILCVSLYGTGAWADEARLFCQEFSQTLVDFTPGTLPFPDETQIAKQFHKQGLIFSAEDDDLPWPLQTSLEAQENLILQGTFFNLFRLSFTQDEPVVSVSVTLGDQNIQTQTHTLTAFDAAGNVVDSTSFTEPTAASPFVTTFPDKFTLTVSSCRGIAFVVATEQPPGAQRLERIRIARGHE